MQSYGKFGAEGAGLHRLPEVDPQAPLSDLRFLARNQSYFFFAGFTDWLGFFGTSFSITNSLLHFGQRLERQCNRAHHGRNAERSPAVRALHLVFGERKSDDSASAGHRALLEHSTSTM